jgi:hypothetical protein
MNPEFRMLVGLCDARLRKRLSGEIDMTELNLLEKNDAQ